MPRPVSILELRSVRGTGGGPEKTILLGAALSDPRAYRVTVCYIRDERDDVFGIDEWARTLNVDYVEVRERHSFDLRIVSRLGALVRERGIDIVHAHDHKTIPLTLLLARRSGTIALATAHGWTGQTPRELRLYYPVAKRMLRRFPRVIAVSTEIKNDLIRHGIEAGRVDVILNGIDPDAFSRRSDQRDVVRLSLGYGRSHSVIGSVGRLERQKRFDLLIDAFARLAAARPALRLAIVGDGSLRSELESNAERKGVRDRVAFLGHRTDVSNLHHAFDVFVQSSEYEGTPNTVLEAMAMETPLVATDAGGTSELAMHSVHGLIVPPRDVAALQSAIETMLDDPNAAKARASASRRRIETELSFAARNRRLEAIYDELVRVSKTARQPHQRGLPETYPASGAERA